MYHFNSLYRDDYQKSTGLLFARVYNNWHSQIKKELQKLQLTHPQFIILASVAALEKQGDLVSQIRLASFSDMDVMTVSQVVKLLLKKKLVERREHPKDSRSKIISLSESGFSILNRALPLVEAVDQEFFGKLDQNLLEFNQWLMDLEEKNG